jgi:uncharacterized membrane protein YfcA
MIARSFLSSAFSFNLAHFFFTNGFISSVVVMRHHILLWHVIAMVAGAALDLQINSKTIAARETKELRTFILPFHFTVNEYCENSNKKVMGHYSC